MEAKKCFWNGIAAVIGLVIVIGELFKGIPNGAFTIGSVLFILGGFLLMIGNSLLMFGTLLEEKSSEDVSKIQLAFLITGAVLSLVAVSLFITGTVINKNDKEKEELKAERVATINQDYVVHIKTRKETEWRTNENGELKPEVELIEKDLVELLESKFHTKIQFYESDDSFIFNLFGKMYAIYKEGDKKICTLWKIDGDSKKKLDFPNLYRTEIYEDKARGIIITDDQIRELDFDNLNP